MEILDLLNEESFSGAWYVRANKWEVLLRMFEKVSQSLKYDSMVHKHIYTCIYIMDTNTHDFTSRTLHMPGN